MKSRTLLALVLSVQILTAVPAGAWQLPEPQYSLRPLFEQYGLTVRDQSGRGTCSVFAVVGVMEFEYAHLLGEKTALSVEYLNWASNRVTGVNEDGSFFSDALEGILRYGLCEDTLFPYYARNYTPKVTPPEAALKDAKKRSKAEIVWIKEWNPDYGMTHDQIEQVKAQIRLQHPVAIGFQWPKGEERWRRVENGIMTVPPREGVFDGHSIIMTGYRDDPSVPGGGWFEFRNSHGTGFSDKGYGRMPYEYLAKYANDGVWVKVGRYAGQKEGMYLSNLDSSKIEYGRGTAKDALSRWLITLDGRGEEFTAEVGDRYWVSGVGYRVSGVGYQVSGDVMIEYIVMGDKKVLWSSGVLKRGEEVRTVRVNLKGVRKLGLLVMNRGKVYPDVVPGWGNGTITYRGCAPFASDNRVVPGPEEILTPAPPATPVINSPAVYGTHPGSPFLYRIPCTGERPVRFSMQNLPEGLSLDPVSGIVTGSIAAAGSYVTQIIAENSKGSFSKEFTIVAGPTLALTPPMGWNSWYIYYSRVSDAIMRRSADKMIESGMADFGYQYVNIDDCWAIRLNSKDYETGGPLRNPDSTMRSNLRFPVMRGLTDYIHAKGLKAGIYGTPGKKTCAGYTGSYGHEALDINTFANWGFDFIKYDWCSYGRLISGLTTENCQLPYRLLWEEALKIRRDIVINLCQYGMADVWKWGAEVGNCWRTTGDLGILEGSSMPPYYYIGMSNAEHAEYAKPGGWNDPDYILIGWFRNALKEEEFEKTELTPDEQYAYMSMWSVMAAPLIYSGEMSLLDPFTLNILCNNEVIAINQDVAGRQARIVRKTKDELVMVKDLADGSKAVAMFRVSGDANTSNPDLVDEQAAGMGDVTMGPQDPADLFIWDNQPAAVEMTVTPEEMGITGSYRVRDVWRHVETDHDPSPLKAMVNWHGVALFRVTSAK